MNLTPGKIDLYLGCMYAQKTSKLFSLYRKTSLSSAIKKQRCILVNHTFDTRYDNVAKQSVVTHDKSFESNCIMISSLSQLGKQLGLSTPVSPKTAILSKKSEPSTLDTTQKESSVQTKTMCISEKMFIFINEGQFFQDLHLCLEWALAGHDIVIAALDFDSNQQMWPSIQKILPFVNYHHQTAICDLCGDTATLSVRKNTTTPTNATTADAAACKSLKSNVLVAGKDVYIVICYKCFNNRAHVSADTASESFVSLS